MAPTRLSRCRFMVPVATSVAVVFTGQKLARLTR